MYNCRNNASCNKSEIIQQLVEHVKKPMNIVDLKNPQYVIIVEICKTNCYMTITNEYSKYKKFNIRLMSGESKLKKEIETTIQEGNKNEDKNILEKKKD